MVPAPRVTEVVTTAIGPAAASGCSPRIGRIRFGPGAPSPGRQHTRGSGDSVAKAADFGGMPMNIVFLTSGPETPASRFRVQQYLPYLEEAGHQCSVFPSRPAKYQGWRWLGNRLSEGPRALFRLLDLTRIAATRPDVVVLERELFSSGFRQLEKLLHRIASCLVLDVDDGLFVLHPEKFALLVEMSDLVIAGNELLRRRIAERHPAVELLPTCLDLRRFTRRPAESSDLLTIGWTGTAGNYPSLSSVLPALRRLATRHRFRLLLIAERPPLELDLTGLQVEFLPWRQITEIEDLHRIDLGIMPLEETEWNRYKCGLKLLQYMAAGIPAVASPVGVNAEIVQHDRNGLLAASGEQWEACLDRLLTSAELRHRLADEGRTTVEQGFSIAGHAPRLVSILQQAIDRSQLTSRGAG